MSANFFNMPMKDVNLTSLVKRCEEKEKQGWEFVTKIKREFRPKDGITVYKVIMRRANKR
jgi:hypothetical protein